MLINYFRICQNCVQLRQILKLYCLICIYDYTNYEVIYMSEKFKILISDDQKIIHETLGTYLEAEGYSYISAYDGDQALEMAEKENPDLIILDLMMPKKNGIDVCREIRAKSNVPIIMLTAKGEEIDRILGLELGADDYIIKPFSPREVLARIKAVLRRINDEPKDEKQTIRYDRFEMNLANYEVIIDDQLVPFTPKEVEVLYLLAKNPGRVFTREQILESVWGYDYYGDTRLVDTQIKRIRQKLPQDECSFSIKSIYGVGYKFEVKK